MPVITWAPHTNTDLANFPYNFAKLFLVARQPEAFTIRPIRMIEFETIER